MNYEAATGSLFIIRISIYLYRISVTRIAVPVGKGSADAARHVKLPLTQIWTEDVSGFVKQNAYGLPEGVVFFLLISSCVFNERNQKCASHNVQLAVLTCQFRESQLRPDSS